MLKGAHLSMDVCHPPLPDGVLSCPDSLRHLEGEADKIGQKWIKQASQQDTLSNANLLRLATPSCQPCLVLKLKVTSIQARSNRSQNLT